MAYILIAYGSSYGQTEKISGVLCTDLEVLGHRVDIYDLKKKVIPPKPKDYDAVIVGMSVINGGFQRKPKKWVKSYALDLAQKPTAFFSVSLASGPMEFICRSSDLHAI